MKKEGFWCGFGISVAVVTAICLIIVAISQENGQMEKLARLHAAELSTCWSTVEEIGGTCRIEYLRDRTGTIYSAKVVREVE